MRHLQNLRRPVPGVAAQAIGRPLDQPLRSQADVVHQHFGAHHRNGQFAAQFLVEVHLLLVQGLFQPDKIQLLNRMPNLDGLAQVVRTHRISNQPVLRPHRVSDIAIDRNIGPAAFVRMELIGLDPDLLPRLNVLEIALGVHIPPGQIHRQPLPHSPHQRIHRQARRFPHNVPQTVVKSPKPTGRLIHPPRPLPELLEHPLALPRIAPHRVIADNVRLIRSHRRIGPPNDTGVGMDLEKALAQRLLRTALAPGMRILDAPQPLYWFYRQARARLPHRILQHQ